MMMIIIIIAIMIITVVRYKLSLRPNRCNLRTFNTVTY